GGDGGAGGEGAAGEGAAVEPPPPDEQAPTSASTVAPRANVRDSRIGFLLHHACRVADRAARRATLPGFGQDRQESFRWRRGVRSRTGYRSAGRWDRSTAP